MTETSGCTEKMGGVKPAETPRLLTIAICEDTLVALLAQRCLCIEELHCPTPKMRQQLRRVLLRSLLSSGEPGRAPGKAG